jgi:HEAT repeat protein
MNAVKHVAALAVLLLSATSAACASSPALRAADSGDRAALTTAVAEREKRGDLSNGEAASLAETVASRDLRAAKGADVLALVTDVRSCARELRAPLEERMATHDEAGAAAALALLDAGELSQDDARQFATDPIAPWRAVGARALVRSEDRALRLKALLDPDPRVRRQAVRAARDDQDPNDLGPLSEAARVDPEPIVRTEAVRALVELEPLPPGELADVLRDLWPKADEGLREDVAIAWASPRVWDQGGSEALLTLVASGHGPGVIEGAAAILRNGTMGGEVVMEAVAQMERAISSGSRERRQQAIAGAPLERPELLAAVKKASEDGDLQVRVAAFARLAQAKQPGALEGLVSLAGAGSPVAQRARFALASLGDRRVQAWVEQDLQAPDAEGRLGAATTLSAMGVAARAAPLLADADASVRVKAACTILLGARRD